MCEKCEHNQSDGSFIFGIILGSIIGAFVAIYIYKNNQSEVFVNLKNKLSDYFSDLTKTKPKTPSKPKTSKPQKLSVVIPNNVEVLDLKPLPKRKPVKMFKK